MCHSPLKFQITIYQTKLNQKSEKRQFTDKNELIKHSTAVKTHNISKESIYYIQITNSERLRLILLTIALIRKEKWKFRLLKTKRIRKTENNCNYFFINSKNHLAIIFKILYVINFVFFNLLKNTSTLDYCINLNYFYFFIN